MRAPRRLAAGLIATMVLSTSAACQIGSPQTHGSTVKPYNAQMPALPADPNAAEAAVRTMMMTEAITLLNATGLRYTQTQFSIQTAFDDASAQNGALLVVFRPCSDQQTQVMTDAIWAHGWSQGGVSHGVNVHKGPLYLHFGHAADGCRLRINTVNVSQYLPGVEDITHVPELAAFKAAG